MKLFGQVIATVRKYNTQDVNPGDFDYRPGYAEYVFDSASLPRNPGQFTYHQGCRKVCHNKS